MAEVVLSTDDLLVLGGPETVNVEVDYGPKGDRGSLFFAGNGEPGPLTLPSSIETKIFDFYLNTQQSHTNFASIYQLLTIPGTGTQWQKIMSLLPNVYAVNKESMSFVNGSVGPIVIPLINLIPSDMVGSVTSENFNIQYSISGTNPIASSLSVGAIGGGVGTESLPITIYAKELVGGEWVSPSGARTIHLFISMV